MRTTFPSGVKHDWYGRNPTIINLIYTSNAIGPHATTTRFTYTCSAQRRGFVSSAFMLMMRDGATGTPSIATAGLVHNDLSNGISVVAAFLSSGTLLANDKALLPVPVYFSSGHVISATSQDLSTGGTFYYYLVAQLVEFDA